MTKLNTASQHLKDLIAWYGYKNNHDNNHDHEQLWEDILCAIDTLITIAQKSQGELDV